MNLARILMVVAMYFTVCVNLPKKTEQGIFYVDFDFRALKLLCLLYDFGTMGKHPVKPRGSMYLIY